MNTHKEIPTFTIREARRKDASRLIDFIRTVADETPFLTFTGSEFKNTIYEQGEILDKYKKSNNQIYLIAESAETIIGILHVTSSQKPRLRHIGEFGITISKKYWGKGVGSALLKTMLDWASSTGIIRKISLKVLVTNAAAIHLYKKFNFKIEGTHSRDFFENGEFISTYSMGLEID